MSLYGDSLYGSTLFGVDPSQTAALFTAYPFTSQPLSYSTNQLSWTMPSAAFSTQVSYDGNVHTCTLLQLVRNGSSLPQSQTDGTVIFSGSPSFTSWIDENISGGFYYYSIFGYDSYSQVWRRCADLVSLMPSQWNYSLELANRFPAFETSSSDALVTGLFSVIGFQYDQIRSSIETLLNVNDPSKVSGALLPYLAEQLGLSYEPVVGMANMRILVANAIHLYKLKGSLQGIREFCTALTGWAVTSISAGPSLLHDINDSIFQYGVGGWTFSNVTNLVRTPTNSTFSAASLPAFTTTVTTPSTQTFTTDGPWLTSGSPTTALLGTTAGASGGSWIMTSAPFSLSDFGGTTASAHVSFWFYSSSGAATISYGLVTLTPAAAGGLTVGASALSGTTGTINYTASSGWVQETFTIPLTNVPSATASLFALQLSVSSATSGAKLAMTLMYMGPSAMPQAYWDPPRDVKIMFLSSLAANELANGLTNFPDGLNGWSFAAPNYTNTYFGTTKGIAASAGAMGLPYFVPGDTTNLYEEFGRGSLMVQVTGTNPTAFGGQVSTVASETLPAGWFQGSNWFPGEVNLASGVAKTWFGSSDWFFNEPSGTGYFVENPGASPVWADGEWFAYPSFTDAYGPDPIAVSGNNVIFSLYVRPLGINPPEISPSSVVLGIYWINVDGSTSVSTQTIPQNFSPFVRQSFTAPIPSNAASFLVFVQFPDASIGDLFLLNAAMVQFGTSLNTYFDSTISLPVVYQGFTSGVGVNGQSLLFAADLTVIEDRLKSLLPEWVPNGASFTLEFS